MIKIGFMAYDKTDVRSASHKICAASARATNLKFLHSKRFRNLLKILALQAQPQVHAQVRSFEKYNFKGQFAQHPFSSAFVRFRAYFASP